MQDYIYQKYNTYYAQTAEGLEKYAAEEVLKLGATKATPDFKGINFEADKETLYKIIYSARLISRILAPLKKFKAHSEKYLYNEVKKIKWDTIFPLNKTFAVNANLANSKISHSKYASLCVKDAIADNFREKYGQRPDVDTREPDVLINLFIHSNYATLSIDASGAAMHKRGYRKDSVTAPMQETIAAAIVYLSGWTGEKKLYDFMCGSGTIVAEALMHYCNIPSGYLKKYFGFFALPDFDKAIWEKIKKEAKDSIRPLPKDLIFASDISKQALNAAKTNLKMLPGSDKINFSVKNFKDISDIDNATVLLNPPYGLRLKEDDTKLFYKELGDFMKQKCKGTNFYIFFGEREYLKSIGLKTSFKIPIAHAALDSRLAKFEIY